MSCLERFGARASPRRRGGTRCVGGSGGGSSRNSNTIPKIFDRAFGTIRAYTGVPFNEVFWRERAELIADVFARLIFISLIPLPQSSVCPNGTAVGWVITVGGLAVLLSPGP